MKFNYKRLFFVLLILLLTGLFMGCFSDTSASPEEVVETYFNAVEEGDYEKAISLFSEDLRNDEEIQEELKEVVEYAQESEENFDSEILGYEKIDEENAVVEVQESINGHDVTHDISLIKEDGEWKLRI